VGSWVGVRFRWSKEGRAVRDGIDCGGGGGGRKAMMERYQERRKWKLVVLWGRMRLGGSRWKGGRGNSYFRVGVEVLV